MGSGLQDIPLRRIPAEWDPQWFAEFVRDVLRFADVRNMRVAAQMVLTGQSGEYAQLAMADGATELEQIEQQPPLSVIGNPTGVTAGLQPIAAGSDGQIFGRSGSSVGFLTKSPVITLSTDLTGSASLTNLGSATLAATIASDAVSNAKLANMTDATVKGRALGAGTGDPTDLSSAQLLTLLGITPPAVYTPTLTIVTNLDAVTAIQCHYFGVGSSIVVAGRFTADPTAAGATELGLSLPIASNIGAREDCNGVAFTNGLAGEGCSISGDAANNRASIRWATASTTSRQYEFIMMYRVI